MCLMGEGVEMMEMTLGLEPWGPRVVERGGVLQLEWLEVGLLLVYFHQQLVRPGHGREGWE